MLFNLCIARLEVEFTGVGHVGLVAKLEYTYTYTYVHMYMRTIYIETSNYNSP